MSERLPHLCLGLWSLGLLGMGAARGLFHLLPGTAWFDAGLGLCAAGGLSYGCLGLLELLVRRGR